MRLRRATIAGTTCVANIQIQENNEYDRRACDDNFYGEPVLIRKGGTLTIEVLSGALPQFLNDQVVVTGEDVAVAAGGAETVTSRTYTLENVSTNRSANFDNDTGRSSGTVTGEFSTLTEGTAA